MAEPIIEAVELALRWQDSLGDCYYAVHDLKQNVVGLKHTICRLFNEHYRRATEEYLTSIGVDPDPIFNTEIELTDQEVLSVEKKARSAGFNLTVRKVREIRDNPNSLGEAIFLQRWSERELVETFDWSADVADVMQYQVSLASALAEMSKQIEKTAFNVEVAGDALDILHSVDGRPFNRQAALQLSAELVALTHLNPGRPQRLATFLAAHATWHDESMRIIQWLCFRDRTLKPLPIVSDADQIVIDVLAREGGNLTTTALGKVCLNLYNRRGNPDNPTQLDRLIRDGLVKRLGNRAGVELTATGWRCSSVPRPLADN